MANYNNLKSAIQSVIRANGNNEITGPILQAELLAMINTLGAGYQFIDVATPTTNPGTPDARVMYLAYLSGTYVNFGGIAVTGFCVLKYDTTWTKTDIPISSSGGGGKSPYIGANGNWYEWSDSEGAYIDAGIRAQGPQGETGAQGAQGPQGPQGNPGSSVDYPFELANNLTTDDATKALSAAQGVVLDGKISRLEVEVHNLSGKYYGVFTSSASLPDEITQPGYAFVGTEEPFSIWNFDGEEWVDTGAEATAIYGQPGEDGVGFQTITTLQDGTMVVTLTSGDTITINLNHNHLAYPKYQLLTDEAEYAALTTKESDTLYLIPE